jgi:iron complex transport system ATP-binding protein
MADYYLKLEDLSVGYGGKPLLSDINIEIDKGEIMALIGPNGAGKSTILKSISRQLKLLGGKVFLMEENVQDLSWRALSKKMAVVLTERLRPELMTCREKEFLCLSRYEDGALRSIKNFFGG